MSVGRYRSGSRVSSEALVVYGFDGGRLFGRCCQPSTLNCLQQTSKFLKERINPFSLFGIQFVQPFGN
jgi:hypothetical protein